MLTTATLYTRPPKSQQSMSVTTSAAGLFGASDRGNKVREMGHQLGASVRSLLSQLMMNQSPHRYTFNTNSYSCADGDCDLDYSTLPSAAVLENSPTLPLGRIPEDCSLNVLSFLNSRDLCCTRATSWGLQQIADLHGDVLWRALCHHDFPAARVPGNLFSRAGCRGQEDHRFSHQRYIKNVLRRAIEEAGNLRATQRARESLQTYATKHGGGIIGLVSDLGYIPDQRIARSVSSMRRAAMSSAVVANERVVYDFRCRGLYSGPLNFLPIRTLLLEHPVAGAMGSDGVGVDGDGSDPNNGAAMDIGGGGAAVPGANDLLPLAPEAPAPDGFLGYVVRLVHLRPEHEYLRWTVLFAVFRDMAVFESEAQAEAFKARMPNQRLSYCALDFPGAQDDPCPLEGKPLPHIGHWGFRPLPVARGAGIRGEGELHMVKVEVHVERLERTARNARSSLAFLQYCGRPASTPRGRIAKCTDVGVPEKAQQAIGADIHVVCQ